MPEGTPATPPAAPPEAPPPAGPPAGEPPAAPPAAPPAEIVYDLKLGEGSQLEAKDLEAYTAWAKDQKLSNEAAQAWLKKQEEFAAGAIARHKTATETSQKTERDGWKQTVQSDKVIGGEHLAATVLHTKRAMDKFAPEGSDFRKFLDETGYGDHPAFVKFVRQIGEAMAEDKPPFTGVPGSGQKTLAERMFPNS